MFICFEGIAGSGKTTQSKILFDYLKKVMGNDVFLSAVYEGAQREIIDNFMKVSGIKDDQNAVMFLFQALHAIQFHKVASALKHNKIVIADRWRYSFFAHHLQQNTFNGDIELMNKLDSLAHRELKPDICFMLKVPVSVAYKRYLERESSLYNSGLKLMDEKYFQSVSDYYDQLAKRKKWNIIDGMESYEKIAKEIKSVIDKKL